jgi:NAD-dependent SIR2 family protein deacetylase
MNDEVPTELVESWRLGNVAVFVGAGASVGSGLPTWSELVEVLVHGLPEPPATNDLTTLARYYELVHGRHRMISILTATLRTEATPNILHRSIAALRPRSVLTTNFDDLLERSLRDQKHPYGVVVSDDEVPFISASICPLVKLHGSIERPASLVFTSRDYELYEERKPSIARLLASELQTKTLLLVGYSASDPDFRTILSRIQEQSSPHARRLFMLTFGPSKLEQLELMSRGINVIDLGPLAGGTDPTTRAAAWLDRLRRQIGPAEPLESQLVSGKAERTRLIIKAAQDFLRRADANTSVIRLLQGYSSLSLGEQEHPGEVEYSRLLRGEHDAFVALLDAGFEIRLIAGRRPVFASDLTTNSRKDILLARRLSGRCARLIKIIEESMYRDTRRLVVVCSTATHLSDLALGSGIVFKGVRSNSSSGYSVTVVSRVRDTVEQFCTTFDREFEELSGVSLVAGVPPEESLAMNQVAVTELTKSLAILRSWLETNEP